MALLDNPEKLKRNQVSNNLVQNWDQNLDDEKSKTFDLLISPIYMESKTFTILGKNNENRIRVYLGLEENLQDGKQVICAFAVGTFSLGDNTGIYEDYPTPIYKLSKVNEDFSGKIEEANASILKWQNWRDGVGEDPTNNVIVRKYIYPICYLLTKYELYEIFDIQGKELAFVSFGIEKSMKLLIQSDPDLSKGGDDEPFIYDYADPCPPMCPDPN